MRYKETSKKIRAIRQISVISIFLFALRLRLRKSIIVVDGGGCQILFSANVFSINSPYAVQSRRDYIDFTSSDTSAGSLSKFSYRHTSPPCIIKFMKRNASKTMLKKT